MNRTGIFTKQAASTDEKIESGTALGTIQQVMHNLGEN
jgi:hypothetical protein